MKPDRPIIRTLIVDDEPLGRERLRRLLEGDTRFKLIGECADGIAAVETIEKESPDLVFLDVQMPELDGFGVIAQLDPAKLPVIVFVTAHDHFALRAFEVHAVDYLLKPFDRERFEKALDRVSQLLEQRKSGALNQKLSALLGEIKPEPRDRIPVKTGGRIILVKTEEIDWVEAADNYVKLHVGNDSHMARETMSALEAKLSPERFARINRSTIVNIDRIKELQPMFHGDYSVILRNGTRLSLSRNHRDKLQKLLGK